MTTERLCVAVPTAVAKINPASGTGTMWRHVLTGLKARVDVRMLDPSARRRWRDRRPDVWLTDCGLGPFDVDEPVVVQVHEAGWDDPAIRAEITPEFIEVVLEGLVGGAARTASHIITPSESARRQVIQHWSLPAETVHAVPHGVDADLFRPGRTSGRVEQPYVLFVSQIHPRKNLPVLRAAMTELAERFPHQLVIVGGPAQDRPDSRELLAAAAADLPGTTGRVVHFTQLPENELADLLSGASAFCLPSLMEGFGLTALEAMSSGVPVVTSNCGSLPEVVGDAGLAVPPTVEAVRDALAEVLGDASRAAELGAAARQRALTFSWSRTVAGWLDVLRRAATGPGRSRPRRDQPWRPRMPRP